MPELSPLPELTLQQRQYFAAVFDLTGSLSLYVSERTGRMIFRATVQGLGPALRDRFHAVLGGIVQRRGLAWEGRAARALVAAIAPHTILAHRTATAWLSALDTLRGATEGLNAREVLGATARTARQRAAATVKAEMQAWKRVRQPRNRRQHGTPALPPRRPSGSTMEPVETA